jgi:succinate dehydrogenase / fumarate reductase, cytochrome b subunit
MSLPASVADGAEPFYRRALSDKGTLYRGGEGQWMWVLHRISGVAIFVFLLVHIADTALIRMAPAAYDAVIGMYHTPIMALGEAGIVAAVTFHALNGLRIIATDALPYGATRQRALTLGVWALFLVAMAGFLPLHLHKALGWFGFLGGN